MLQVGYIIRAQALLSTPTDEAEHYLFVPLPKVTCISQVNLLSPFSQASLSLPSSMLQTV